jgi:NAD(P)H-quinone oxidoreductase subunit 5
VVKVQLLQVHDLFLRTIKNYLCILQNLNSSPPYEGFNLRVHLVNLSASFSTAAMCLPIAAMVLAILSVRFTAPAASWYWRTFLALSVVALFAALVAPMLAAFDTLGRGDGGLAPWLRSTPLGMAMAVLVQLLGTVIGVFSWRYLEGEGRQRRYLAGLAGVLASVQLFLLADHWVVMVVAWALVGRALQHLLCFYAERPFALLAAHKKRLADRLADGLLLLAAALAWTEVGSGAFEDLWAHIAREGLGLPLQVSALALVLAVVLRTALLPVHGWIVQVMEAPTPVSALLHAGVVNLGGFALIRFAPMLEHATMARVVLVAFGLATAVLAGLVMLTRVSIKVRLAWSTVAQMGFMVLECGLGLYTLAALHLIGHSLYKAHAFLSASNVVRETRIGFMRDAVAPTPLGVMLAPVLSVMAVAAMVWLLDAGAWPWWWTAVLGFAWAPLLWHCDPRTGFRTAYRHVVFGLLMVAGLCGLALLAHALPWGLQDHPNDVFGLLALLGMVLLYLSLVTLQLHPHALQVWRRWSYAGFYVDEAFTRLVLQLWPAGWTPQSKPLDPQTRE